MFSKPRYDDRTLRGWPLPHWLNKLDIDSKRLRDALCSIDETVTELENNLNTSAERQDSIDTRLDTIIEGATEDTEILDARVDAENEVHPNLGHNIRNLHRLIREQSDVIIYAASEFQGLLQQYSDLAQSQIQNELNVAAVSERRKQDIQSEASIRNEQVEALQLEADTLAQSDIQRAIAEHREHEYLRENQKQERASRIENNENLSIQIEALAEAILQTANNFRMTVDRMKSAIQQEITKLSTHDEVLQSQTDSNAQAALTNALNLHKEAEERRKVRKVLDNEIQQRTDHDSQQDEQISENSINIETERQVRFAGEAGLAKQTASNAEANIQNALNLHEVSERRKEDLAREKQARIEHDEDLQLQADDLAEGLIKAQVSNIKSNEQRKSDINWEAQYAQSMMKIYRNKLMTSQTQVLKMR